MSGPQHKPESRCLPVSCGPLRINNVLPCNNGTRPRNGQDRSLQSTRGPRSVGRGLDPSAAAVCHCDAVGAGHARPLQSGILNGYLLFARAVVALLLRLPHQTSPLQARFLRPLRFLRLAASADITSRRPRHFPHRSRRSRSQISRRSWQVRGQGAGRPASSGRTPSACGTPCSRTHKCRGCRR